MGAMMSGPASPADLTSERLATYHSDCGYRLYNNQFGSRVNGLPTSCFGDVVLGPLPTWVLLALLAFVFLPLVIVTGKRHKASNALAPKTALQRYRYTSAARGRRLNAGALDSEHTAGKSYEYEGANGATSRHFTNKTPALWTALSILYLLLILASLLMNILEIVRLILANRGPGLLPFTLAGILLVLLIMHLRYSPSLRPVTNAIVLVFWTLSLIFYSIRLSIFVKLMPVEPRDNTEYHDSDEQIDVGVIVGLYAIFFIVEALRLPMSIKEAALTKRV